MSPYKSFYYNHLVLFRSRANKKIKSKENHERRTTLRTPLDHGEVTNAKGRRGEAKEFCLGRRRKKMKRLQKPGSTFGSLLKI